MWLIDCFALLVIFGWGFVAMLAAWPEMEKKGSRWVRKR
jgi:CHASE2 domain-containing sensor protein